MDLRLRRAVSQRMAFGRRAPLAVAPGSVSWRIVAGATAVGLLTTALRFGRSGVHIAALGSWLALQGLRHVPVGHFLALILPGLTDPSLLGI
jgi:hypothetical protein